MQPSLVIKQGTNVTQIMQPSMVTIPMTVSSSISGSIPNVMTLNKPAGQNVVTTQNLGPGQPAILPNVQILNMRPAAPTVAAHKSVAAVSPRVVIGTSQIIGSRPANPGITLQSLQPGQQNHLLFKTESGQYQLLRVGHVPSPAGCKLAAPPSHTIRLSTVPEHPGVATASTSVLPPGAMSAQMQGLMAPMAHASGFAAPLAPTPSQQHFQPQSNSTYVKPSDNTKEKCRNFLSNLLDLSSNEPPSVELNVRNLIQELIDARVEPEEFCERLERLLNASPQPCLIGFLKKSLPLLRKSLVIQELIINGINPPAPHVAFGTLPLDVPSTSDQVSWDEGRSSPDLTLLLPPVRPDVMALLQPKPVQKPAPQVGGAIAVLQDIPVQTKINVKKVSSGKSMAVGKSTNQRIGASTSALSTVLIPGKSVMKDKEKKSSSQFSSQQYSDDKMAGDDDINDVAAMGGVNLAEESQRILGSTEMIGTQIRSCKEEYLVPLPLMQARVKSIVAKCGMEDSPPDVSSFLIHAMHERLKTIVEKLAVIAQHRVDMVIKTDSQYEVTQDVKGQLKFLEELDRVDMKRREDSEREILLRAAKSRSKNEDPEQAKLKAKAKEMQRAELEELRQREANLTALQAIGPRKKPRLDGPGGSGDSAASSSSPSGSGLAGRSQLPMRTRMKRINQRDMMFLLENDKDTAHSLLLYKSYLK